MKLNSCIKKVQKYLTNEERQPIIVNLQNNKDIVEFKQYFDVGDNKFISISDFAKQDDNINIETMLNKIATTNENIFLTGLTSYLKMLGEEELRKILLDIISMTISGKLIVICYQCELYIQTKDPRLTRRICFIEGKVTMNPRIVFISKKLKLSSSIHTLKGINMLPDAIETEQSSTIYVITSKVKSSYPNSMYIIENWEKAYDVLVNLTVETKQLQENFGTEKEWNYALENFKESTSWEDFVKHEIGMNTNLEMLISKWGVFTNEQRWVYFIALKLWGAPKNWCLNTAAKQASNVLQLKKYIYRSLMDVECDAFDFWEKYNERKELIEAIEKESRGKESSEVVDYCNYVIKKESDAIYYVTDATNQEKELIFKLIDKYSYLYNKEKLEKVLSHVYPALYLYLQPYNFKQELLNNYFQEYKYQKVLNKIFPEFENIVEEQAKKREFNLLLPTRAEIVDKLDKVDYYMYFIDAMGVEYLGYIIARCNEMNIFANIFVCRCNVPSLTRCNKEFLNEFSEERINNDKRLDSLKHEGKGNYNYEKTKLPIHLIKELEIIDSILENARDKLIQGKCKKVFFISDHGASRLAVLKEDAINIDVNSKGIHSGRVCEYNEKIIKTPYAIHENEWYVLASYDRFKGGRKASVEVHGGATLEEVVVPVIELTYGTPIVEVEIITPEVYISFRKKTIVIEFFTKVLLKDIQVLVNGKYYLANIINDNKFSVDITDIKKKGKYKADVYSEGNLVASGLVFEVKKEGVQERDIL